MLTYREVETKNIKTTKFIDKTIEQLEYGDFIDGDFKLVAKNYCTAQVSKDVLITGLTFKKENVVVEFYLDYLNTKETDTNIVRYTIKLYAIEDNLNLIKNLIKTIAKEYVVTKEQHKTFMDRYYNERKLSAVIEKERIKEERNRLRTQAKLMLQKEREL